jgi:hypothetical protein
MMERDFNIRSELAPGHGYVQIQAGDWRVVESLRIRG